MPPAKKSIDHGQIHRVKRHGGTLNTAQSDGSLADREPYEGGAFA